MSLERPATADGSVCMPTRKRKSASVPARLPPMEVMPVPCLQGNAAPGHTPTSPPRGGRFRMLQGFRKAPALLAPMEETPGLSCTRYGRRCKGWDTAVDAPLFSWMHSSELETSAVSAVPQHQEWAHPRMQARPKTHASMDAVTSAQSSPDQGLPAEHRRASTAQRNAPRLRRARSEVPVYSVSAGTKRKAVSALQQFFFQELSKGDDPNGAAAKALLRLNDLSACSQATPAKSMPVDLFPTMLRKGHKHVANCDTPLDDDSSDEEEEFERERQARRMQAPGIDGSSPLIRPATPLVGRRADRTAIRVGMCG